MRASAPLKSNTNVTESLTTAIASTFANYFSTIGEPAVSDIPAPKQDVFIEMCGYDLYPYFELSHIPPNEVTRRAGSLRSNLKALRYPL